LERRQFRAFEASEEAGREPCVVAEALDTENPPVRLHAEAAECTISVEI